MTALPKRKYTLEEYFELDKNAEGNFEYFDGEIFEMSGVSPEHATIEMNLAEILNPVARKRGCRAFPANLRIKVPALPTYRYPDLSVVCGETRYSSKFPDGDGRFQPNTATAASAFCCTPAGNA